MPNNTKTLELFFDIVNLKIDEIGDGISNYIGPLYKEMEFYESLNEELGAGGASKSFLSALKKSLGEAGESNVTAKERLNRASSTAKKLIQDLQKGNVKFSESVEMVINFDKKELDDKKIFPRFIFIAKNKSNPTEALITAAFFTMVSLYKMVPYRVATCNKCGNYFYMANRLGQKFCSVNCSNKGRS